MRLLGFVDLAGSTCHYIHTDISHALDKQPRTPPVVAQNNTHVVTGALGLTSLAAAAFRSRVFGVAISFSPSFVVRGLHKQHVIYVFTHKLTEMALRVSDREGERVCGWVKSD